MDLLIKEGDVIVTGGIETEENNIEGSNQAVDNVKPQQEQINKNEPLTFRIEKVIITAPGGSGAITMEGEESTTMESTGTPYRIVPSYDKDPSEWTEADKEAYSKAVQEIANIAKAEYDEAVEREEQIMKEMEMMLQQEMEQNN